MKVIRIEMPDGSRWQVPARLVGENRIAYYASLNRPVEDADEADYLTNDESEIRDWGRNNMNWEDVSTYAIRLPTESKEPDFQEGWVNGKWEIVDVGEPHA